MDPDLLRIIDANLNRAREALRVIEDFARFALDDAPAATRAKELRHALRALFPTLEPAALLAARDIVSDVGRNTKTAAELERATSAEVLRAAFGRLTEAARSLSEYGKLLPGDAAPAAERLRYAAYELEQRIVLRATRCSRLKRARLYVLITAAFCRGDWLGAAAAALRGGAGCLQLREKSLADAELLKRARQLRELTTEAGALFFVNDRPDIARLAGADGVHVGQDDLSVRDVRRIAGGQLLVGKSTHTLEQLAAASAEEPDYIAVGPMFPTATKPQEKLAGPEFLTAAAQRTAIPLVAIGGITPPRSAALLAAGASCLCVCSAIVGADDPERASRAFIVSA